MNETLQALERLRAEWVQREGRRARGGVVALSGFHFQLLSTLRERVLAWCARSPAERAVPPVIDEFLSDALSVAPDGGVVIAQAKRVLRAAGVADALDELWRIDELAREVVPDLAPRLEYRVRTAQNAVRDVAATIAAWTPEGGAGAGALASFLARTRAEVLGDPMEKLLATLANELNAPDPLGLVRSWLGLLLERTAEGAAVAAARQIWSDLWALHAAAATPPGSGIVQWQDDWAPPAELRPGGYLTGRRPTVRDLRDGSFAPRPEVYDGLAARAEAWIAAAQEQGGGVRLPVFWIGGRSGAGKSVALLHVLAILHERERGPVLWLGNKIALLPAAMSRARMLRFREAMAIVGMDDPYSPEGQADPALVWREALATVEAARQVGGAAELPLVVCCGPTEQAERFREEFPDDVEVTLVEVPRETEADLARLREWYRVRTGREPPDVGDRNVLLVQLFFEWRVEAPIFEFAARLRTRIRAAGRNGESVYEFLSVMLAMNRLYVGLPAAAWEHELTAEQQDLLDVLRRDNHLAEDVRAGEAGLWLAHPHLSNAIYENWFPLQKNRALRGEHLRTGVRWALQHGTQPPARTAPLWAIVRGMEADETAAGDVVGRIDRESLPRLLARIHEDLRGSAGSPLPLWLLPVWVGLRAACPEAVLVPDPVAQALAELRPENVGQVGLRLTCHMLVRHAAAHGEAERRAVQEAVFRVLSGAPGWHEWAPVAVDALRNGLDGGLAGLAAEWAVAHPASTSNPPLLLAAWSAAPDAAAVHEAAARLIGGAPATFGWGDVGQELLRRAPADTVPAVVAEWCERHRSALPSVFLLSAVLQKGYAPAVGWAREWAELWHMERSANFVLEPLFRHAPGDPDVFAWCIRWVSAGFAASGFLVEALLKARGDDPAVRTLAAEWLRGHHSDPSWFFVWRELEQALGSLATLPPIGLEWLRAAPHHASWPNVWLSLWEPSASEAATDGPDGVPAGLRGELVQLGLEWMEHEEHHPHALLWLVGERVSDALRDERRVDEVGMRVLRTTVRHPPRWWPFLWQFLWGRATERAELDALARTWLPATRGEKSSWWYVFAAVWETGSGHDALAAEGIAWLRGAEPDEPTWGRIWTLLWDAGRRPAELHALALRWLRDAPRHGSWGHVWRRLWESGAGRALLERVVAEWLEASLEWMPVQWPYVWQAAWTVQALRNVLAPLAVRWLGAGVGGAAWGRVFGFLRDHGTVPGEMAEVALTWLRGAAYNDAAWGMAWRWLWDSGEHRDELVALALAWLAAQPEHRDWSRVMKSLWDGGVARGERVRLALDWLGSGAGTQSQRARVFMLFTTPENGDVPELARWLAAAGPAHPAWGFLWTTLLGRGVEVSPTPEEALAWVQAAPDAPGWQNVWRVLWGFPEHHRVLVSLGIAWLRRAGSFDAEYAAIAKLLSAAKELRPQVMEIADERLRVMGVDAAAVRRDVADVARAQVEGSPAAVPLSVVGDALKAAVGPLLQETGWLGLGSLKALLDSLDDPRLATAEGCAYVPGVHEVPSAALRNEELRDQVVDLVREYVATCPAAVPLAVAAQHVREVLGADVLDGSWAGYRTFKALLQSVPELGIAMEVSIPSTPGYLFIPGIHAPPERRNLPAPKVKRRYDDWTWEGPPPLSPDTYAEFFRLLAELLPVAAAGLGPLSRSVWEHLNARRLPAPRDEVARIVTGLSVANFPLSAPGPHDPRAIADAYFDFMLHLRRTQPPPPSAEEQAALREQIVGAMGPSPGHPDVSAPR